MGRILEGWRPYLFLTLFSALVCLPGWMVVPPLDRDEARFAQATKQMVGSGDYLAIYFQDTPRNKKPVGIHWLQAPFAAAFDDPEAPRIWPYRIPSMLGAWVAVLACFALGARLFGRGAGLLAAMFLAASPSLIAEAQQAKTDAVLLATVVLAMAALAKLRDAAAAGGPTFRPACGFWAAIGASALIKGPIGPFVVLVALPGLALCARDRRWTRHMRWVVGPLLAAAVAAPWFLAVAFLTDTGFLRQAVSEDLFAKILSEQESHGAPPGTHLLLAAATLWPASLFAVPALIAAVRRRREPAVLFCLAWLLPGWLVFEAVPTKLTHYTLPFYPALCLLAGAAVAGSLPAVRRGWRWTVGAFSLLPIAAAAALLLAGGPVWSGAVAAGLVSAGGLLLAVAAWKGPTPRAAMVGAVSGALALGWVLQFHLPRVDGLWVSRALAETLPPGRPVAAAGFHEPSLVFLVGTGTLLASAEAAAAFLHATPNGVAVVEGRSRAGFDAALGDLPVREIARISGFNYAKGKSVELVALERGP